MSHKQARNAAVAGLSFAVSVLLGACGQATPTQVSNPAATPPAGFVTALDYARTMAACLRDKGWEVTADESNPGAIILPGPGIPAAQDAQYLADRAQCIDMHHLQMPEDTPEIARIVYEHYLAMRVCLQGQGYVISDAPTEASFVSDYLTPGMSFWNPFVEASSQVTDRGTFESVTSECPQIPPALTGAAS